MPKVQEISSSQLLSCFFEIQVKNIATFKCEESILKDVKQELLKRLYKPIYIPIIAILCCFLVIASKNNVNYYKIRKYVFISTFFLLVFSETSLRYSTSSNLTMVIYFLIPWIIFVIAYMILYRIVKNV